MQIYRTSLKNPWTLESVVFFFSHNNNIIAFPGGKKTRYHWTVHLNCGYCKIRASCHPALINIRVLNWFCITQPLRDTQHTSKQWVP